MPDPVTATTFFGIKYASLLAGFAGGVVSLSFVRQLTKKQMILSVIVGAICAGYITPLVIQYFHFTSEVENGAAFLVGLTAMNIVPGFLNVTKRWRDDPNAGRPNGYGGYGGGLGTPSEPPPRAESYGEDR